MKTHDEVVALFRDKYAYLKAVCQDQIEPFNASAIHQNPDGGWQLNLDQPGTDYKAAITLRPNDEVPHETHGVIGARWFQEGGAFDNNGLPSWLGYPVTDEERKEDSVGLPDYHYLPIERIHELLEQGGTVPSPACVVLVPRHNYVSIWKSFRKSVHHMTSQFEFGEIEIRDGLTWERATEELNYNTLPGLLSIMEEFSSPPRIGLLPPHIGYISCLSEYPWPSSEILDKLKTAVKEGHMSGPDLAALFGEPSDAVFVVPPEVSVALNESGKRHAPKDIESSVETILSANGFHVVGGRSWLCDFFKHLYGGIRWVFRAEVKDFDHFSILAWREGTDIHARISARSKSIFGHGIDREIVIPNRFRAI